MLTGRKLLLADDSAAIRKVIELTFSDEGMEVITVPDGRSAFEKMIQVRPDLVLADVYMPEVDGYELCRSIKQDERFAKIPVVLLISSFEPFDEAEARRAGADDVVTKPFQSIRQLVSRVGSLLNKGESEPLVTDEYPTMEISHTEPMVSATRDEPLHKSESELQVTDEYPTMEISHIEPVISAPIEEPQSAPQVTVLVEAPIMEHVEPAEPAGVACSTDVELQTADTMKLERIVDEPMDEAVIEDHPTLEDTIEVEPVEAFASHEPMPVEPQPETVEIGHRDISEPTVQTPPPSPMKLDDAVLDLEDELLGEPQMVGDDVFLDLDFADSMSVEAVPDHVTEEAPAPLAFDRTVANEAAVETEQPTSPAIDEPPPMMIPEESASSGQASTEVAPEPFVEEASVSLTTPNVEGLSPAAIEAIARRMVEQMSDKVIREIAWQVVPELSELLIKRKLEEQK